MYYLLDSENISLSVLVEKIQNETIKIEKNSTLIIFFNRSTHYSHTDMKIIESIFKKVIIESLDIPTKDALDTYLIVYLGHISNSIRKKSFCIISNDKGYNGALHALKKYKPRHVYTHISFRANKPQSKRKPYGKTRQVVRKTPTTPKATEKAPVKKTPAVKKTKPANPHYHKAYKTIHRIVNQTNKLKDDQEIFIKQVLDLYASCETPEDFSANRIKLNAKYGLKDNSLNTLDNQYPKMHKLLK